MNMKKIIVSVLFCLKYGQLFGMHNQDQEKASLTLQYATVTPAHISVTDYQNWAHNAFLQAVEQGDVNRVRTLLALEDASKVESYWSQLKIPGLTVTDKMKLLSVRPNIDRSSLYVLNLALQGNHVEIIKLLLPHYDKYDVNRISTWACKKNYADIVELVLTLPGVNVNGKNLHQETALSLAYTHNSLAVVNILLMHPGIDIHAKDRNDHTILSFAFKENNNDLIDLLLPRFDIDLTMLIEESYYKITIGQALFKKSCKEGRIDRIKLLLGRPGVDINAIDKNGECVLDYITDKSVIDLLSQRSDVDYSRVLNAAMRCNYADLVKKMVADCRADEKLEEQVLNWACSVGDVDIVRFISAYCLKAVTQYSIFPLQYACRNGCIDVVKLLLADNRCVFDNAAFMSACIGGHIDVVKLLLADSRVDVNEKDKYGNTPFMYACREGRTEIVKLLLVDSRVNFDGINDYAKVLFPLILELKSKGLCIRFLNSIEYLSLYEVNELCTAFADDHELCVKIKEKVLPLEKVQEFIRWQMLEEEGVGSFSDRRKKVLTVPFVQELSWQEEGLVSFAHGCEYQFGIFRDAYARLQRKLSADGQKYPAYFHAFRFPTQKELQEKAWSKEQAQEQLRLRKNGRSDNSLYLFCQTSLLHGIQNYKGESPGYYWLNNWSIQNISLTLAQVLQGLIDPVIIERYQHKLAQVQQLYDNTVTSSTKGLLYLFAVTPEFVKNCVGYRHNFTGKDELTSSEQYLQAGKYEQVEHLIPQLYVTAPEYVNAHIKDMKVYGYDKTTLVWKAYDITLEEVLDLLVREQKELERIGKVAYVQQMKESALRQQGLLSYFKALKSKIPLISRL